MKRYKICVYAISKNEEKFADRWMKSVGEADQVIVLDTGSKDRTVEKLRAAGAQVYQENIQPFRFDTARNRALDYVPEDADLCVSNDLDEVFSPGWRKKLEEAWHPDYTRARYLFVWSHNAQGAPLQQFPMEKIHRRQGFRWIHPVHEVLTYTGPGKEKALWIDDLVLHHYPDSSKPRQQYLPLLALSAQENPTDDQVIFWLGREYLYHKKYDDCIRTLKNHLSLPTATWKEERSASMGYIGTAYEEKGQPKMARPWFFRSLAECPSIREPYLRLARFGYTQANWPLVYAMVKKGLSISKKTSSYLMEPDGWGEAFYDLGAISAYSLGLYEESQVYAKEAVERNPRDPRLKENLRLIQAKWKETTG